MRMPAFLLAPMLAATVATLACHDYPTARTSGDATPPTHPARSADVVPAGDYTAIDLGTLLGGTTSRALSINSAGQIVGRSDMGGVAGQQPFLWEDGVMTDLIRDPNRYPSGTAYDINDFGFVVGEVNGRPAIMAGGDVEWLTSDQGVATAIGNTISDPELVKVVGWTKGTAWLWTMRKPQRLSNCVRAADINSADQILVQCEGKPMWWVWQDGGLTGVSLLEASAINDSGQVVGTGTFGERHAALWRDGVVTDLGTLGGTYSAAYGINNAGQIVGTSEIAGSKTQHAFLWENGVMTDLGGNNAVAVAINNAGLIVGTNNMFEIGARATLWRKLTPVERVEQLTTAVDALLTAGTIGSGEANSLGAKLDVATAMLNDGKLRPAVNQLGAFINQVQALVNSGRLTPEQGQALMDAAQRAITAIAG